MIWFNAHKPKPGQDVRPTLASRGEIEAAFEREYDELYWIAFLITGDAISSAEAISHARELSFATGIFQDWLTHWARSITARVSIDMTHDPIIRLASRYEGSGCSHGSHEVFSDEEILEFRQADPNEVIAALDPIARSVAVLRGVRKASTSECASLLGLSRRSINGAYCHALQWIRQQTTCQSLPASGVIPQAFHQPSMA